jgi:hypothetical protein
LKDGVRRPLGGQGRDKAKQPTKQCLLDGPPTRNGSICRERPLITLSIIRPTQNSKYIRVKINQLFLNSLKYKIYLRELGGNCWEKFQPSRVLGPTRESGPSHTPDQGPTIHKLTHRRPSPAVRARSYSTEPARVHHDSIIRRHPKTTRDLRM